MSEKFTFNFMESHGRGKNKVTTVTVKVYERLSLEDYKSLQTGDIVDFISRQSELKHVKVTSVKTWKRNPNKVHVGVKFGLYEYSYSEIDNDQYSGEWLVKEVESEESNEN